MNAAIETIQNLVGNITEEQYRFVDCFASPNLGVFMPIAGPCYYSLSPEHTHPAYMFCIPFNDCCRVEIGGHIINVPEGMMQAVSPMVPHTEIEGEAVPRYVAVMIAPDHFEQQMRQYPLTLPVLFRGECYQAGDRLIPLLQSFMAEADSTLPGNDEVLAAYSQLITHEIIRCIFKVPSGTDQIINRMEINRAIQHMTSECATDLTVERLADRVHMSPSHFSRLFRKETGLSPMAYLATIRLHKAKKLLRSSEDDITQIASECGFASSAGFSAFFRKQMNCSPSGYRGITRK